MKVSSEKLMREAQATGFRPEVLEKVIRSLGDSESMPNLLQRKQDIPGTRRPGPASAPPFR
jgi:hypothetical protein